MSISERIQYRLCSVTAGTMLCAVCFMLSVRHRDDKCFCLCRESCLETETLQLLCLSQGTPLTLQEFADKHSQQLQLIRDVLLEKSLAILDVSKQTCKHDLLLLHEHLLGPAEGPSAAQKM